MKSRKENAHVELGNARHDDQIKVMKDSLDKGVCPFCSENLARYHKMDILKSGEHWLLTYNQWPYENTQLHLLAITKYHANSLSDVKPGGAEELFDMLRWAEAEFKVEFGGIGMRFGDIKKSGATIDHLHAHFIVPKENLSNEEKVKFKIS